MDAFSLEGQVAVITGGGTGLGLGMARCMVQAGARVALVGRREDKLIESVGSLGPGATYQVHDVQDTDRADDLVSKVRGSVGEPTILVNNAGIHLKKDAVETAEDELLAVLHTHLIGAHALTRAFAAGMLARGAGSILFNTSMAAIFGIPRVSAYTAAKSACLGLVRSLAVEWSPRGVRVNAIAPGWIESPMLKESMEGDPKRAHHILERTPLGRFGEPEDIGWGAVYLCSKAGRFITGQQLVIDGGVSIGF